MDRIRYIQLFSAAIAVTFFGILSWFAIDSATAEAAGMDVWNIGRLEVELRDTNARGDRLNAEQATNQAQIEVNQSILYDVINGKRKLAEAAGQLWKMNLHSPGYTDVIPKSRRGPTILAKVAHNIIVRAAQELYEKPTGRRALIARLRAEYEMAFGVIAPEID